jgi:hypothetical protein
MPPCARGKATDDHQTEWFGSSTLSSTSLLSSLVHSWAPPDSARRPAESSQLLMKYSMRRLSRAILHSVRCMGDQPSFRERLRKGQFQRRPAASDLRRGAGGRSNALHPVQLACWYPQRAPAAPGWRRHPHPCGRSSSRVALSSARFRVGQRFKPTLVPCALHCIDARCLPNARLAGWLAGWPAGWLTRGRQPTPRDWPYQSDEAAAVASTSTDAVDTPPRCQSTLTPTVPLPVTINSS